MSNTTSFILIVTTVAVCAVYLAFRFFKENRRLTGELRRYQQQAEERQARIAELTAPKPRRTREEWDAIEEERRIEQHRKNLEAVKWEDVTFYKKKVMSSGGEFDLFNAAWIITGLKKPTDHYPFYVFPQVNLGEIIGANANQTWRGNQAYGAINSKRCDLTLANRFGYPVAIFEFQGGGHYIGGDAVIRDETKRIAIERAGLRYVPIENKASQIDMRRIIRDVLDDYLNSQTFRIEQSHTR